MSRYHIWTVGCQVNVADSGKLAAGLRRLGWDETDHPEDANLIVINTCAVRQNAEDRATAKLDAIAYLKRREAAPTIAVMGCMVGPHNNALAARFPYVDVFARPQDFDTVLAALDLPMEDWGGEFWPEAVPASGGAVTAYVPVIEGCDKFCTYCIVPLRRGRERSRAIDEILREVVAHVVQGVREVTLLGQTVEAYGKDQPSVAEGTAHADLSDLMAAIHDIPDLERIRALTSYPPDMTDRILEGMAALPKVCESLSLPVQSGSNDVLTAMRRGYAMELFVDRVERVRALMPEVGISTDVIVGFPGETEAQFQETLDLLAQLRFDKVHVAAYSTRPGTYAAKRQPDDVPQMAKMERLYAIETLQRNVSIAINETLVGQTLDVLVEETKTGDAPDQDRITGRTRTAKLVHFDAPAGRIPPGALVDVLIARAGAWSLQGALAISETVGPETGRSEAGVAR